MMRYEGKSFSCEGSYQVVDATIGKLKISIDYIDEGGVGLVSVKSTNGIHYDGTYGRPGQWDSKKLGEIKLEVFKNSQGVLLVAKWVDNYTGNEGIWLFRLTKSPL